MTAGLTRSDLLRRAAVGGAALTLPGAFAALARGGNAKLGTTLTISNWPLYIDIDEKTKKRPTIEQFQRRYGVKVKYIEDINDNATFFGKIQAQLSRGQSIGRDIIVLTDNSPYPSLLIERGWVEKLDKSVLPNIKNLQDALKRPGWDPNRTYSLPWQSGITGLGYNTKRTKPITTVDQLLTDKRLHGKVTLLTEMADSIGLVMLSNGDDPVKVTDASFDRALKKIERAVKSGQIRQFTGNDYSGLMAKGDVWAAFVWSGDMVQLNADNKSLRFALPKSDGMIWTDNMLIPKGGDATTASTFMNFVYDPKIQAQIEDYVNYICPVKGTKQVLLKTSPSVARNPLIFPTPATLRRVHQFDSKALSNPDYRQKWQKLLGA
jgi:spermidine/putrescine transport system substrate-binding protein